MTTDWIKVRDYILDRFGEASTWQGIGFVVALFGCREANMDWGQAAGLGGVISAVIKMIFPDKKETNKDNLLSDKESH